MNKPERYDVVYEYTNSGITEGTEIIATLNDVREAQAVAGALNAHHGYEAEEFEGVQDVKGYYVRVNQVGRKAVYFADSTTQEIDAGGWYTCGVCLGPARDCSCLEIE
ncbi:hypothetical protein KC874_00955 [Candidatus Saccharibacteria bacterium]|nr:hypothetical protein [Candidatus Saccharibacteria bacterium]